MGRRKTVIGTPYWMAPEVILCETDEDGSYDVRCDIWSTGIVAIELAEGVPPLVKTPPMQALFQIPKNKPPTLNSKLHKWSKKFQSFVGICLAKDPEQRPGAMAAQQDPFISECDRRDARDELQMLLATHFAGTLDGQYPEDWVAPDVVQKTISEDVREQRVNTMVLETGARGAPESAEARYGRAVRTSDNLATLGELDEDAIVYHLRARYCEDVIYTNVGEILLACNPFKQLSIYTPKFQEVYLPSAPTTNMPPHIYQVAQRAFKALQHTEYNQVCVISGESGAGKTETSKRFMQHILTVANSGGGSLRRSRAIDKDILAINPVLEAVGNAQTVMNKNSSRFGKFLELKFDLRFQIKGAQVSDYLLEKSRVVHQSHGERNFHVLYGFLQDLSGNIESTNSYFLEPNPTKYRYLGGDDSSLQTDSASDLSRFTDLTATEDDIRVKMNSKRNDTSTLPALAEGGQSAARIFKEFKDSLEILKISVTEMQDIEIVLAVILHIGNIGFAEDVNDSDIIELVHVGAILKAADLAGVLVKSLAKVLLTSITVTRGEEIVKRRTVEQAIDTRNAAAKGLYGALFRWLVSRINNFLVPAAAECNWIEIGVLDIFGFENFDVNSFEQLCINVANEQLQYYFNQQIFSWELEDMISEGLDPTNISFVDNKRLLDMFLLRPSGIFAVLDEESFFPKGTDLSFVEKLGKACKKHHDYYGASKQCRDARFTIFHYAGEVGYNTHGFLEKNRDSMAPGITDLFSSASNALVRHLFTATNGVIEPQYQNLATEILGQGITHTQHIKKNQSRLADPNPSSHSDRDNLDEANQLMKSSRRGLSMRKSRRVGISRRAKSKKVKPQKVSKRTPTVSTTFKTSLADLMQKIMSASPHFVRCLKPNSKQVSDSFDKELIVTQLRYTGVCETIRIRKEGYPIRLDFSEFMNRYQILAFPATREIPDIDHCAACVKILGSSTSQKQGKQGDSWQLGKTKIFLKHFVEEDLANKLDSYHRYAGVCQRAVRGYLSKLLVARLKIRRQQEAAERERLAREAAEKEKAAREAAEKEKAAQEAAEKEKAAREAAEKEQKAREAEINGSKAAERVGKDQNASGKVGSSPQKIHTKLDVLAPSPTAGGASRQPSQIVDFDDMELVPWNPRAYDALEQNLIGPNRLPPHVDHLNRYINILPNPHTRVRLEKISGRDTSGYINANYISGYSGTVREYIATQGPTPETAGSFWRMVWEQDSRAIVMVTGIVERGIDKCFRYWPSVLYNETEEVGHVIHEGIRIQVQAGFRKDGYITSKLKVTRNGETREIWHFWFDAWPDHGVPKRTDQVVHMLRACRAWSENPQHPWIVHCSAGIGRTGTFIAIDIGMKLLLTTGRCDVIDIIRNLRKDRGGMVQHSEQALFVFTTLKRFIVDESASNDPTGKNEVLRQSVQKAHSVVPSHFTVHPSQEDSDEGADDQIPAWRLRQIELRDEKNAENSDDEVDSKVNITKRKQKREEAKRAEQENRRRQASLRLREGDMPDVVRTPKLNSQTSRASLGSDNAESNVSLSATQYATISKRASTRVASGIKNGGAAPGQTMIASRFHKGFKLLRPIGPHSHSIDVNEGARVTVVKCLTEDWYLVRLIDGKEGLYPATNLVIPGADSPVKDLQNTDTTISELIADDSMPVQPDIAEDATAVSSSTNYTAIAPYQGRSGRELSFEVNERLLLQKKLSEDWLQVRNEAGDIGIAPANHLQRVYKYQFFKAVAPFDGPGIRVSLQLGEVVKCISKLSPDWLEVEQISGKMGLAPYNHLQELDNTDEITKRVVRLPETPTPGMISAKSAALNEEVIVILDESAVCGLCTVFTSSGIFGKIKSSDLQDVNLTVSADYAGGQSGHMRVKSGDRVVLIRRYRENGIVKVRNANGKLGLIPADLVADAAPGLPEAELPGPVALEKLGLPPEVQGRVRAQSIKFQIGSSTPSRKGTPMAKWTSEQVLLWLDEQSEDIRSTIDVFANSKVTGSQLVAATDESLSKLGLDSSTMRVLLLKKIEEIKADESHLQPKVGVGKLKKVSFKHMSSVKMTTPGSPTKPPPIREKSVKPAPVVEEKEPDSPSVKMRKKVSFGELRQLMRSSVVTPFDDDNYDAATTLGLPNASHTIPDVHISDSDESEPDYAVETVPQGRVASAANRLQNAAKQDSAGAASASSFESDTLKGIQENKRAWQQQKQSIKYSALAGTKAALSSSSSNDPPEMNKKQKKQFAKEQRKAKRDLEKAEKARKKAEKKK